MKIKPSELEGLAPPEGYTAHEIGPGPVWVRWEMTDASKDGVCVVLASEGPSLRSVGDSPDSGDQET